jgi:segregation and condensation protein B
MSETREVAPSADAGLPGQPQGDAAVGQSSVRVMADAAGDATGAMANDMADKLADKPSDKLADKLDDRLSNRPRPEYVDFSVDDFPGGLAACLEAILMVADQPQTADDMARVLAVDEAQVSAALEGLRREYNGSGSTSAGSTPDGLTPDGFIPEGHAVASRGPRGFELRHTARGWQFASRAEFEPVVAAFITDGQTARLSQAALEALAIVAYRQPVTRAQVAAIRGVNSDGVIRSLAVRGLIREEGTDPDSRAALLGTSELFLEQMGLNSLDELPSLAPFLPAVSEMTHPEANPAV